MRQRNLILMLPNKKIKGCLHAQEAVGVAVECCSYLPRLNPTTQETHKLSKTLVLIRLPL